MNQNLLIKFFLAIWGKKIYNKWLYSQQEKITATWQTIGPYMLALSEKEEKAIRHYYRHMMERGKMLWQRYKTSKVNDFASFISNRSKDDIIALSFYLEFEANDYQEFDSPQENNSFRQQANNYCHLLYNRLSEIIK